MRPSRETDYPASVGILYLSPKLLVLAGCCWRRCPVGVKFEAECQVLWSDLDLSSIAAVWVLFLLCSGLCLLLICVMALYKLRLMFLMVQFVFQIAMKKLHELMDAMQLLRSKQRGVPQSFPLFLQL